MERPLGEAVWTVLRAAASTNQFITSLERAAASQEHWWCSGYGTVWLSSPEETDGQTVSQLILFVISTVVPLNPWAHLKWWSGKKRLQQTHFISCLSLLTNRLNRENWSCTKSHTETDSRFNLPYCWPRVCALIPFHLIYLNLIEIFVPAGLHYFTCSSAVVVYEKKISLKFPLRPVEGGLCKLFPPYNNTCNCQNTRTG